MDASAQSGACIKTEDIFDEQPDQIRKPLHL
jgi:hypothetical protein